VMGLLLVLIALAPTTRDARGVEDCLAHYEQSGALPIARLPDPDTSPERYEEEYQRLRARYGELEVCARFVFEAQQKSVSEADNTLPTQSRGPRIGSDFLGNPRYQGSATPGAFEVPVHPESQ
jgi:hypothetical protein